MWVDFYTDHTFLSKKEVEIGCLKTRVGRGCWLQSTWSAFCILFFILAPRIHVSTTHSKSVRLTQNWHRLLLLFEFLDLFLSLPRSLRDGVEFKKRFLNGTHKCFIRWESSRHKKKSVKMECSIRWNAITWKTGTVLFGLSFYYLLVIIVFCYYFCFSLGLQSFFWFLLQSFKALAEVAFSSVVFVYN